MGWHESTPSSHATTLESNKSVRWNVALADVEHLVMLLLCHLVAHRWHAIWVTEAMRLRAIQGMRGLRPLAENPYGADAVLRANKASIIASATSLLSAPETA
jgi:hypothetical protein